MSPVRADAVDHVSLVLELEDERVLSLDLASDGGVRRAGTGQPGSAAQAYQGLLDPSVFRQVVAGVTDDLLAREGRYSDPDPQGTRASLSAVFAAGDERTGLEFRYGAHSQGPPPPLTALVTRAVGLTDEWYDAQVADAG